MTGRKLTLFAMVVAVSVSSYQKLALGDVVCDCYPDRPLFDRNHKVQWTTPAALLSIETQS